MLFLPFLPHIHPIILALSVTLARWQDMTSACTRNLNADGHSPNDLEALSPPESLLSISPTAYHKSRSISIDEEESNVIISSTCSRRTLFYLIATLNASFQDYDFSNAKSEEFSREPKLEWVINSIKQQFVYSHWWTLCKTQCAFVVKYWWASFTSGL